MFFDALIEQIKPAETVARLAVNLTLAILILVLGLALARLLKGRLVRLVSRRRAAGNLASLLGNALFIGIAILSVLLILSLFGIAPNVLLAVLGAGTVAIGLALQDVLKNLFAGIYLLLEQPFRIGDTIVVDNREGEVESIDVRATVLRMSDGTQALVPNAVVFATTVMNRTAYPARRASVRITDLEGELDSINDRVVEALKDHPDLAHTPGPRVHAESISNGKVTVLVDVWRKADRQFPPDVLLTLQRLFPGATVTLVTP
jgi:small-conductance mechanosensitive channel